MRKSRRIALVLSAIVAIFVSGCGSDQYDDLQRETLNPTERAPRKIEVKTTIVGPALPKRKPGEPGPLIQLMFRAGQYTLDLPTREDPQTLIKSVVTPNGIKWKEDNFDLEIAKGTLTFNGQSYGTVNNGDVIKVWPTGKLTVNGGNRAAATDGAAK